MSQASAPSPSPSWDATEGSIGRADRTAWQAVLEMRRQEVQVAAGEGEPGAAVILTDVAQAFGRVLLIVAWCQTMKFVFSQRI